MESPHSRIRLVWAGQGVLVGIVAGIVLAGVDRLLVSVPVWAIAGVAVLVAIVGVSHAARRYQVWGFELQEDSLYLERGVITFVETAVPFVRVQHVDTQFGPLERALGLSSLVVYTAGSRNADVTIPGLRPDRARELQERLRDLAVESETEDAV